MSQQLDRRTALKMVLSAGAASLTVGIGAPRKAEALAVVESAVFHFGGPHGTDRFTIRGVLDGPSPSQNPEDFDLSVVIVDRRTGAEHSWSGTPTVVR